MPEFAVEKTTTIEAPPQAVFDAVRDFRSWPAWSPWLIAEPGCKLDYREDGTGYTWDGEIVGSGEMAVVGEEAPRSIDCQLDFLKPWKSRSAVRFAFAARGGATEVTWTMRGSLPFFMFWMKGMMTAFVGMDYQRGLAMLKDHVEKGSVPCELEFAGVAPFEGFPYLGVKTACAIAEIGPRMGEDFEKLKALLAERGIEPAGKPFSIYHKWALTKGLTEYTIGFPVGGPPATPPSGFVTGELPSCRCYQVRHTGPYHHLGNAWASGMMHARAKVFRQNKRLPPFEIYQDEPGGADDTDLVTTVHFPAR